MAVRRSIIYWTARRRAGRPRSYLRQQGVEIREVPYLARSEKLSIEGRGPEAFISPPGILDCGNSGTTMRLLMGVLAGQKGIHAQLTGDHSLVKRPMKRVAEPLKEMGALFRTDEP